MYNLYGELKFLKVIKPRKIRWFDYILRKEEGRMIDDIMDVQMIGNKGREKSGLSWKRQVEE